MRADPDDALRAQGLLNEANAVVFRDLLAVGTQLDAFVGHDSAESLDEITEVASRAGRSARATALAWRNAKMRFTPWGRERRILTGSFGPLADSAESIARLCARRAEALRAATK